MNCPHCRGELPAHRPTPRPGRYKLYGHHGEMDVDAGLLGFMVDRALENIRHRREMLDALDILRHYREVAERMEYDPAFASHVLCYDGQDGWRWFPGAARAARRAEIKERLVCGQARKDDLVNYMELSAGH